MPTERTSQSRATKTFAQRNDGIVVRIRHCMASASVERASEARRRSRRPRESTRRGFQVFRIKW